MPPRYAADHVASDDLDAILEMSRVEHESMNSNATSSTLKPPLNVPNDSSGVLRRRQALNGEIAAIDAEISTYDRDIQELKKLRALRVAEREKLVHQLDQTRTRPGLSVAIGKGKGKEQAGRGIDYGVVDFDWYKEMKLRMKKVFGIDDFRLCQRGVCNANMDGRDIVCVMPTGGGKSLTYQLPALLTPGCTLVISPLIALIADQIMHLKDAGVEAVMLTGSTSQSDSREISARLISRNRASNVGEKEIKLCYVTPEKIARSNAFKSVLTKMSEVNRLARIVIDEAHCVSQLGHDFRPDYQKLNILRQLFPRVPIMALSATCPPQVLKDLIKTLRLPEVVDGSCADTNGTVYFSAPLYRKNLHYRVMHKPSSAKVVIKTMTDYILEHHDGDSGIVYCLSKRDAEEIAEGLQTTSDGKIRTGVYHADVNDREKESLHRKWREGKVKVVCATIAFGLGIDKGDVRFVLHHSMSKSMDGFYQESGRAGRDGKDADCILYYRPQDASRLSALICGEKEGQSKLHDMLRFAQNMRECRKVHFAQYFSASAQLAVSAWTADGADALAKCGHCDNCTRTPDSVDHRDVTRDAWMVVRVAQAVHRAGGRVTLSKLADLARGLGGGAFDTARRGKGRAKDTERVDFDIKELGSAVGLSKDDTETMLVELITLQYLQEVFTQTAYSVNVYLGAGPQALRLTRFSEEDIKSGKAPRVLCSFRKVSRKPRASGKGAAGAGDGAKTGEGSKKAGKRKRVVSEEELDDIDPSGTSSDDRPVSWRPHASGAADDSDEEDDDNADWAYSLRDNGSAPRPPPKKPKSNKPGPSKSTARSKGPAPHIDQDVLVLSSD